VKDVDPEQPIADFRTLDESVANSLGARRLTLLLLSFFATVSVLLAAVGFYAAASHGVTQRTREIGIRMALGADRRRVVRLIAGEGVRVTAVGLLIGVFASIAVSRLISAQLYDVKATDPFVLAPVAALLGVVSIAAAWIPARRAVRIDPLVALQPE
jgi:putative ABC transport system permease protein